QCIPQIIFDFHPHSCPIQCTEKQFPLWLAYSTTFNSCQGQTFDFIVLDGRSNVFSHGWLYTAISRV
ncbi:hypothetical protein BS47DRAFT_1250819, partial [Hydnum rufescens UP504]